MNNFVIATAGHIDHGKTTLVKRLTGIETDCTKEEKDRGMSINLGFAHWDLPDGNRIGIVDVPGHERFIKNMVAGLSGINLVLLTIDANEGVMPQTKEHLSIVDLLGIKDILIVLTKCDTVDNEWLSLVQAEIRDELMGTIYETIPIIQTDAVTGRGIQELTDQVILKMKNMKSMEELPVTRLNVDRSFSVKGFGTVVTGTLIGGQLQRGDTIYIYPGNKKTRIRNIQVYEEDVEYATQGMRTALNVSSLKVDEVKRGTVISNEVLSPTYMIDAKVKVLSQSTTSLFQWQRVRVLIGTREVMARVVPLGREDIRAGEEGYIQLRLEEEIVCQRADRFIIRSYSPIYTIAGGEVIDESPLKHKQHDRKTMEYLELKTSQNMTLLIADYFENKTVGWESLNQVVKQVNLPFNECQKIVEELCQSNQLLLCNDLYIHINQLKKVVKELLLNLDHFHKKKRLLHGMPILQFEQSFPFGWTEMQKNWLMQLLVDNQFIKIVDNRVSLYSFNVHYNVYQEKAFDDLAKELDKQKFMVTAIESINLKNRTMKEVFLATEDELYTRLDDQYIIGKTYFDKSLIVVKNLLNTREYFTLADFRDAVHSSRKSSMLILEKMDRMNLTKRVDNYRISGKEAIL